ncbi:MAG: hypothetical protein UT67_C0009G0004 [Candidatus Magasanikbacteria bacterium GW2011_GWA2_40_10]|uniref:KTSC domain-containing protein n=1 Tax=Candidatus Magasanikbacteria bacterium GW2011_GWA2_40_10 TaxID=1619037 RepID=A0A0G0Q2R8_9BACT|nr:MAG: hypothetical protein UT67_C0009G0004 [Candidatus Magasanikbacteria bacterium GW2011_GWA2_40_10]
MKSKRVLRLEVARNSKVVRIEFDPDGMTTRYHFKNGSTYTFIDASSEAYKKTAEATYKGAEALRVASDKLFRMELATA